MKDIARSLTTNGVTVTDEELLLYLLYGLGLEYDAMVATLTARTYVNDILLTGNDKSFIQQVVADLDATLGLQILGSVHYFLGIFVNQIAHGLQLNQSKYAQEILLKFGMQHCNPCSTPMLEGYTDSDWASSLSDRQSISGYCIFLGSNLVQWSSKKQQVVALSSTEAEYCALAQASIEITWLQKLFQELHITIPSILVLWCDNTSVSALASNPVFHACTKHIEIDVHFVRKMVQS
ncbi:uncharacterized protein LOC116141003 [Pistacia vera]|uniref:uncharacterized protein LOC116141003 n=1 Tax=Pistacia vera TaxID=55513 RepID=UPI0012633310|nr:uncharacterized protein LOC116141003 [Pistacia vera]